MSRGGQKAYQKRTSQDWVNSYLRPNSPLTPRITSTCAKLSNGKCQPSFLIDSDVDKYVRICILAAYRTRQSILGLLFIFFFYVMDKQTRADCDWLNALARFSVRASKTQNSPKNKLNSNNTKSTQSARSAAPLERPFAFTRSLRLLPEPAPPTRTQPWVRLRHG